MLHVKLSTVLLQFKALLLNSSGVDSVELNLERIEIMLKRIEKEPPMEEILEQLKKIESRIYSLEIANDKVQNNLYENDPKYISNNLSELTETVKRINNRVHDLEHWKRVNH